MSHSQDTTTQLNSTSEHQTELPAFRLAVFRKLTCLPQEIND